MANPPGRTWLRRLEFLGGQVLTEPDNQALTLPAGTTAVELDMEGAEGYYAINQTGASAGSHGYVPAEGARFIGPLTNLRTVHVHATGATVHVLYFREG